MITNNKRIILCPIEKKDLIYLNIWRNSENVFKFLGGGFHPISINQQEKWLDEMIDLTGKNRRFLIKKINNDEPIGMVGLYDIDWINRTCEIGLFIGNTLEQKKGYGQEAYILLENYARLYLNIRKIKLKVVLNNEKAILFWEKLGFLEVGRYKSERFIQGEYRDVVLMEKFIKI